MTSTKSPLKAMSLHHFKKSGALGIRRTTSSSGMLHLTIGTRRNPPWICVLRHEAMRTWRAFRYHQARMLRQPPSQRTSQRQTKSARTVYLQKLALRSSFCIWNSRMTMRSR